MAGAPWIMLSATNGMVEKDQRLWISIDWSKAPGATRGYVEITGTDAKPVIVDVDVFYPSQPKRDSLDGFVEANGCVSIEAEHYTKKINADSAGWEKIDNLGRTLSGMAIFPVTAQSVTPPANSPHLEYQMYLFHPGKIEVESIISPTLNFVLGRGLRFAISFDDQPPQIVTAVPGSFAAGDGNRDWEETVKDGVRKVESTFTLKRSGWHILKFWMVDPGVVLQKIVVNLGGVKSSYLGPPESYHEISR
jgi:hypothetical protein